MFESIFLDKKLFEIVLNGEIYCNYPETQFNTPIPRIGETINLDGSKYTVKNVVYSFENKSLKKISVII